MIQVRNPQDFWAGILFMIAATIALWRGWEYPLGTVTQMGPGFVPRALSWALLGIGGLLAARGVATGGERIMPSLIRPQLFVILAIVAFGLMIERYGLAPAVAAATILAALASREMKWIETVTLAVVLAGGSVVLFITLLGQSMQKWVF
jgi:putative tricarboxylic transport membrane protein